MASNKATYTQKAAGRWQQPLPSFMDYRREAARRRQAQREAERLAGILARDVASNWGMRRRSGRAAGS